MKKCCVCKHPFPADHFHKASDRPDGLSSRCKQCMAKYQKKRYRIPAVKKRELARARKWKEQRIRYIREQLLIFFATHPCTDCNERDPVVLDFDHVGGRKIADVSYLIRCGQPWAKLLTEIRKCEVVCANCHRKRTAKRSGWWSYNGSGVRVAESPVLTRACAGASPVAPTKILEAL